MTKFTVEMARTMTQNEVIEFWRNRQREQRDAEQPHYTTLVDVKTDAVVAEV